MYCLFDKVLNEVDLFFTDVDIIDETNKWKYIDKSLKTMRENFCIYSDIPNPFYLKLAGHDVVYKRSLFFDDNIDKQLEALDINNEC